MDEVQGWPLPGCPASISLLGGLRRWLLIRARASRPAGGSIRQAAAGGAVVFGNPARAEVLQAAGLKRARGVSIAYPDSRAAERVVAAIRRIRSDIPIIVRVADESDAARLMAAGATEVVPEVFEGGLLLAAETLGQLGIPIERAVEHVRIARAEHRAKLAGS